MWGHGRCVPPRMPQEKDTTHTKSPDIPAKARSKKDLDIGMWGLGCGVVIRAFFRVMEIF